MSNIKITKVTQLPITNIEPNTLYIVSEINSPDFKIGVSDLNGQIIKTLVTENSGSSSKPKEFFQTTPAQMWTLNHGLGYRPHITVLNSGGAEMISQVIHTSVNQALVYFDEPKIGFLIFS